MYAEPRCYNISRLCWLVARVGGDKPDSPQGIRTIVEEVAEVAGIGVSKVSTRTLQLAGDESLPPARIAYLQSSMNGESPTLPETSSSGAGLIAAANQLMKGR